MPTINAQSHQPTQQPDYAAPHRLLAGGGLVSKSRYIRGEGPTETHSSVTAKITSLTM